MCHDFHLTRERLKDEIADELLEDEETRSGAAEPTDDLPSFLNEEREAEVDILTDGGETDDDEE